MLKNKLMSYVAMGALFMGTVAPAAFADVGISGNGSFSHNNVSVSENNSANIQQNTTSHFNNNVDVHQNTGGNVTSGNTGGNVTVRTGDTTSEVSIENMGGSNNADLSGLQMGGNVLGNIWVSGNGFKSHNNVHARLNNSLRVNQNSYTNAYNNVHVNQNTGHNFTSGNTGGGIWSWDGMRNFHHNRGNVSVSTGDATSDVMIHNMGGSNELQIN